MILSLCYYKSSFILEIKIYNKNNILMMFKLVLFDDFESMLLSSLIFHNNRYNLYFYRQVYSFFQPTQKSRSAMQVMG